VLSQVERGCRDIDSLQVIPDLDVGAATTPSGFASTAANDC